MAQWMETRVRVRYAETDQMGVVYHANYLVWFEVGRVEFMRSLGLEYRRLEEDFGCLISVVEAQARYKLPARYDDDLLIRTGILMLRGSLMRIGYEIVRVADGVLLATGETTHMVVGRDMKRRALPEPYERAFRAMLER
ncbi:acyl-CoA thioesterase [Terriglobus sp.]|uniref:acyl-CoA thioesterase n=1 Tax=Terriglobus sp. TaxID=1889013 RepID=UPI003B00F8D8